MRLSRSNPNTEAPPKFTAQTLPAICDVAKADWNGLQPARGERGYYPFTDWDFLKALEVSGSAAPETGWTPLHLWLTDEDGAPIAVAPLYAKTHSQGEYVFDHSWADAAERAGLDYFPKLLCAIPFTPAPGLRLLAKDAAAKDALIQSLVAACHQFDLSGVHVNFTDADTQSALAAHGFMARTDRQFHFVNDGYETFDDFLAALSSKKRKNIRAERRKATQDLTIKRLRGDDIKLHHWDAFFEFYIDTSQRKWGRPYLSREFFTAIHETMREQVLLVLAYDGETPIAGALNFIGGDALYGRHWGANCHVEFLHFELCYYQAIEAGIELGLGRVEAGAQGEHKLARGYAPTTTYSAHYLRHAGLRDAIDNYLARERRAVAQNINTLENYLPFKKGG